ncbi:hypothetical protein DPMN_161725 [Dreissena polymorpha]|uniref:Uncharacterized protein n=1 Tax=Dreissena polymorpha TaxID=45954 RepID=A0A9D4ESN1_DREPO|nr:hypothetical protein DPMN_161725 [Dreissena polymorpha]
MLNAQNIIRTNLLTKKNSPPLESHVFQANIIIFELIQDIIETNLLTKFHEDWTINVASRVLTRKNAPPLFHDDRKINVTSRENDHVLLPIRTIFELNRHIQKTHVLTKFHEDWTKNVTSRVENCPAPWRPCFSPIWTIFELVRDINETTVLNKFHDDWAKIVTSRVFTRNTATPPGSHVFQRTGTIFELNHHIIQTNILTNFELRQGINQPNVLTKFHEDWIINVKDGRRTKGDHKSSS